MPTATLLYPESYSVLGRDKFLKNVPRPVTPEMAAYLATDPRFIVDGLHGDPVGTEPAAPPVVVVEAQQVVIAETAEPGNGTTLEEALDLVPEGDENYDEDGKPSLPALSLLMGRVVTEDERDRALAGASNPAASLQAADAAEAAPVRTRIVRKRKAPDPTIEDAQEI